MRYISPHRAYFMSLTDYIIYCSIVFVLFACKALLNEAQAKLVSITEDQNQYKSILESLVEQVTYRMIV